MIKEIFSLIEVILKVKNVILNDNEKKIVIKLILSFDKSSFFEPDNTVQYSFMSIKGKLTKIHYFQDYLIKHSDAISEAISESNDSILIEKLKGFKRINKESQQKLEALKIMPNEVKKFRNSELPKLKSIINHYRIVMCYAVISLIDTVKIDERKVTKANFKRIVNDFEMRKDL